MEKRRSSSFSSLRETSRICPVCRDTYKDPRILSCLHVLCVQCISGIMAARHDLDPSNTIQCPVCRTKTQLPVSGVQALPRNTSFEHTTDSLHPLDQETWGGDDTQPVFTQSHEELEGACAITILNNMDDVQTSQMMASYGKRLDDLYHQLNSHMDETTKNMDVANDYQQNLDTAREDVTRNIDDQVKSIQSEAAKQGEILKEELDNKLQPLFYSLGKHRLALQNHMEMVGNMQELCKSLRENLNPDMATAISTAAGSIKGLMAQSPKLDSDGRGRHCVPIFRRGLDSTQVRNLIGETTLRGSSGASPPIPATRTHECEEHGVKLRRRRRSRSAEGVK